MAAVLCGVVGLGGTTHTGSDAPVSYGETRAANWNGYPLAPKEKQKATLGPAPIQSNNELPGARALLAPLG